MTIDILIPTYNRKNYLKKAIDSILIQSYKNINIIISDNNSNDWTNVLVNEYLLNYENIFYYEQVINIWALNNFKKCIYKYSSSDYLLFLSDDDELYDKDYIKKAIQLLENNKDISIVMSNTKIVYEDLDLKFNKYQKLAKIINWKDFFINYWTWDYSISWCNAIFNRKLAIENDCYNWKIFYADSDCFFRLMMFWNIWFINTIWSIYRLHGKNSYKLANVDNYINNASYITRNYNFAKKYIEKDKIEQWKERMFTTYFNTVYNNLILFSDNPLKNIKKIKEYLSENNIYINKSWVNLFILFTARYLMKIKLFHKIMILLNNQK